MENSLTENKIGLFCEDFLRLLNFNQKKHKERVPCFVGEPDSGKTSLFYPILRLIHHRNVATVTKQKVFKKAMIGKNTEVIFIDEATPTTLDVDDWKILTQGGYTACDVKYKTDKSFFNRCPMFMTAQQKLQFKEEDQQGQQNEERMRREIQRHERHQQRLRSKGVSEENERLLPHNPNEPLPTPIRNDLAIHEQMTARADRKEKKWAREAFQSPWLRNTERELNECMVTLESSIMPDMRDSMDALCEILEEKLKDHHNNLGTLGCQEALAERKKVCVELGLLRKEDQHMVKTLFEALPVPSSSHREEMEEVLEQEKPRTPNYVPQDNLEQYGTQSPCTFSYVTGSADDDDKQLFITPSTAPRAYSLSSAPKGSYQKRRSQPPTSSPMPKRGRITHLFSLSQQ